MPNTSEQWDLIQSLFEQTLNQPLAQRSVFLDTVTAPEEVLAEVRAMLIGHQAEPLAMETSAELLLSDDPAPERLGAYQIIRELGRGGMGVVYLAQRDDNTFDRQVAIKTLNQVINSAAIGDRFRNEQQIHARLDHPNIAQLLDAGIASTGKPFLVMQFIDGVSIIDYAKTYRCDLRKRLNLFAQVCDAVAFAHTQLILHRDIKPSNILVDQNAQVVLLDFGIAKLLDDHHEAKQHALTREGEKLMTLSYASPEQIRGEDLSTASDVYSLGVVLYELLTGRRPFSGDTDYTLSESILRQDADNPVTTPTGQQIPRDLQAICLKALEKRTQDRYASVSALSDDLQRYQNHEAISVRPPGVFHRFAKFWLRNPIAAPLGTIAIIGILISLAAALWQTNQAEQQRVVANNERDRAQQVVELLMDLFDVDPFADTESRRDDISLREFLVTRAENMQDQLSEQPELQANLLGLFANLHSGLGNLQQAEAMAVKALAMQRQLHGDMHLEVATVADVLGGLRQYQARFDEAEQLFREALAIRSQLLPESHVDYSNSINNLSTLLYARGRPEDIDEMISLDERTLAIREQYFGQDSLQVAESLNNIAAVKIQRNQADDWALAESMFRRAIAIRSDQLGEKHVSTANSMSNLASLLRDMGQLEEAEALFLKAIDIAVSEFGENHSRVSAPLFGLGRLYQGQSRWDDAHRLFLRSLKINQATLPANHPYILQELIILIETNLSRNDLTLAKAFLSEAQAMEVDDTESATKLLKLQAKLEGSPNP